MDIIIQYAVQDWLRHLDSVNGTVEWWNGMEQWNDRVPRAGVA